MTSKSLINMNRERKHDDHMPQYSPENLNLSDKKY